MIAISGSTLVVRFANPNKVELSILYTGGDLNDILNSLFCSIIGYPSDDFRTRHCSHRLTGPYGRNKVRTKVLAGSRLIQGDGFII